MYPIVNVGPWLTPMSEIQLPAMQRGFVWKTSQIECLWDSIFRGYPIGSMMLSMSGAHPMLIDGQQRTTSIALGFYNPWNGMDYYIGNAADFPVVWIDVCPREMSNDQKYVFRVVTRSHPWGYQCRNNAATLPMNQRRKASEMYNHLFGQSQYTKLLPTQRLPYDATCPVPLCFVLEEAKKKKSNAQSLIDACKRVLPEDYRTAGMKEDETYFSLLESADLTSLLDVVKERVLLTDIPSIELSIESNDTATDISTIFARLDRQGTSRDREEQMRSIADSLPAVP